MKHVDENLWQTNRPLNRSRLPSDFSLTRESPMTFWLAEGGTSVQVLFRTSASISSRIAPYFIFCSLLICLRSYNWICWCQSKKVLSWVSKSYLCWERVTTRVGGGVRLLACCEEELETSSLNAGLGGSCWMDRIVRWGKNKNSRRRIGNVWCCRDRGLLHRNLGNIMSRWKSNGSYCGRCCLSRGYSIKL